MVKITDVAALAGVSKGAVSRVLSGDPTLQVSEETRKRVFDAAKELSYVPSHAARALRTSRSRALALVVPDVTSAVFAELARGAEDQAHLHGVNLVLASADRLEQDEGWLRSVVGGGRVDGVIVQLPDGVTSEQAVSMLGEPMPLVAINSVDCGSSNTIVLDDAAAIEVAVTHLVELGHTSIGFVGGAQNGYTGPRRRNAFLDAIERRSLQPAVMTECGYSGAQGGQAASEILEHGLPTALVVANLNAALGLLGEFHARGVQVPDEVSVVALHDVWYADVTWPPITTVCLPLRALGAAAVEVLLSQSGHQAVSHRVVSDPPPELIVRASTPRPSEFDVNGVVSCA